MYDIGIAEDQNAGLLGLALETGRKLGQHSVDFRNNGGVVNVIECGAGAGQRPASARPILTLVGDL